jgi:hypothetical protein
VAFRPNASPALAGIRNEKVNLMSASLTKKVAPDRSHIATSDENEVKYLSRHLGVSQEELLRAVDKVGNSTPTVRKELGKEPGK